MKSREIKEKAYFNDDEYYYKIIRKNIKKFRLSRNLTQQDLADMTDLSREYICDIENDSRNKHLTIAVLGRIAEAILLCRICEQILRSPFQGLHGCNSYSYRIISLRLVPL